jgi:hypothetical protein
MKEVINVAEAYDKGRTLFMGMKLLVAPGALIPGRRPNCLAPALSMPFVK